MYRPYSTRHRAGIYFIINIIIVCLLYENCLWAQFQLTVPNSPLTTSFKIPESLGRIEDSYNGNSSRVILHIRDSHVNYEAQVNYAGILDDLFNRQLPKGRRIIGVEGASGELTVHGFRSIPDEKVKKIVSNHFLKNGYINGAEYFSIFSKEDTPLFGVEDPGLYKENLNVFKRVQGVKKDLLDYIKTLQQGLDCAADKVFSGSSHSFFKGVQDYYAHKIGIVDYIELLNNYTSRNGISLHDYPSISASIRAVKLEKAINLKIVEKEREQLIGELQSILVREEIQRLTRNTLLYRLGSMRMHDFYRYLARVMHASGIDAKRYPNLMRYIRLCSLYGYLDFKRICMEIKCLEELLKKKMFIREIEWGVDRLYIYIRVIKNLLQLQLTREELKFYKENHISMGLTDLGNKINIILAQYNIAPVSIPDFNGVTLDVFEEFYNLALERDNAIISNILNRMDEEKADVGILVTGGFHTEGIKKQLFSKGISYAVISPKITGVPSDDLYLNIMMGEKSSFEKMLMHTGKRLAPPATVTVPAGGVCLGDPERRAGLLRLMGELVVQLLGGETRRMDERAVERVIAGWTGRVKGLFQVDTEVSLKDGILFHSFTEGGNRYYSAAGIDDRGRKILNEGMTGRGDVSKEEVDTGEGRKITIWFMPESMFRSIMQRFIDITGYLTIPKEASTVIDETNLPVRIEKCEYDKEGIIDIQAEPRHQEAIYVIEGRIRVEVADKEQIVLAGELISTFGSYTAVVESGTRIIRVIQKDEAGLTADLGSDLFMGRVPEDMKRDARWERDNAGNMQFVYLPASVSTRIFATLSDISWRLGIATKSPEPGLGRIIHRHPADKPEIMIVASGQVKYIVYDIDGKKIGEQILNPGDMIICISPHNAEFIEEGTKVVEVPVGPFSPSERWNYYDLAGAKRYLVSKLGDKYDEGKLEDVWKSLGLREEDAVIEERLNSEVIPLCQSVTVFSKPNEAGIVVLPNSHTTGGEPFSGNLYFDKVNREIVLYDRDGNEVPVGDFSELNRPIEELERGIPEGTQLHASFPVNNLYLNYGIVAFSEGKLYTWGKGNGEGELERRVDGKLYSPMGKVYHTLVSWKGGRWGIEDLVFEGFSFDKERGFEDGQVYRINPETGDKEDITDKISSAISSPMIVRNGEFDIRLLAEGFDDMNHPFRLPLFKPEKGFSELYFGTSQLVMDKPLIYRALKGEAIELDGDELNEFSEEEIEKTFTEWGYRRVIDSEKELELGDYILRKDTVRIRLRPGINPLNLVGINRDGELIICTIPGKSREKGATLQDAARLMIEKGAVDVLCLSQGRDGRLKVDGEWVADLVDRSGNKKATCVVALVKEVKATSGIRMKDTGRVHTLVEGGLDEVAEWLNVLYPECSDRFKRTFIGAKLMDRFNGLWIKDIRIRLVDGNENLLHVEGDTVVIDVDIFGEGADRFEPLLYAELVGEEFRHLIWRDKGIPDALEEVITDYLKLMLISSYSDGDVADVLLALMLDNDLDDKEFYLSIAKVLPMEKLARVIELLRDRATADEIASLSTVARNDSLTEAIRYAMKEGVYGEEVKAYLDSRGFEEIINGVKKWLIRLDEVDIEAAYEMLADISKNFYCDWDYRIQELYRWIDWELWERVNKNPYEFMKRLNRVRLQDLWPNPEFRNRFKEVVSRYYEYMEGEDTWLKKEYPGYKDDTVAYFSMEYGIRSLKNYGGGLGVLAGDYMRAVSDSGVPIAGVGLLYKYGYFTQRINDAGQQMEEYIPIDYSKLPLEPVLDGNGQELIIPVILPGPERTVYVKVWQVRVGRNRIIYLDTDLPQNGLWDKEITSRLYRGKGTWEQLAQEYILGIAGVRALKATGIKPSVYHLNEGHAVLGVFELIKDLMQEKGISFGEAKEEVRKMVGYTNHTIIEAGNEAFSVDYVRQYFTEYCRGLGLDPDRDIISSARRGDEMDLTLFAMQMSSYRNGVSQLHGEVLREIWGRYGFAPDEIDAITNGVHREYWMSPGLQGLIEEKGGLDKITDTELWDVHNENKKAMIQKIRALKLQELIRNGMKVEDAQNQVLYLLDPNVFTIVWSRRFAPYKNATLFFRDIERLERLLARPVQIIFAGKSHPLDEPGKKLIEEVVGYTRKYKGKIVFVENYDLDIAPYFISGADLWLNTPKPPQEACGTSGMKALFNGIPSLCTRDGWCMEGIQQGVNGWLFDTPEEMYDILEREILPLFNERDKWIKIMRNCIKSAHEKYDMRLVVQRYVERMYKKLIDNRREVISSGIKRRVKSGQEPIEIASIIYDGEGSRITVRAGALINKSLIRLTDSDGYVRSYSVEPLMRLDNWTRDLVRSIQIVTGNTELAKVVEDRLIIDIDVLEADREGNLKCPELLEWELEEEIAHLYHRGMWGRSLPELAIDEVWTDIQKIVLFNSYWGGRKYHILAHLRADNDIDDKDFARILERSLDKKELTYYITLAKVYGSREGVYPEAIREYINRTSITELASRINELQRLLLQELQARGEIPVMYIADEICAGITVSDEGFWCDSKKAKIFHGRREAVTVTDPHLGEMIWYLDRYDEGLDLGIYTRYEFVGGVEEEGLGPVLRNIGHWRMIRLFRDREMGTLKDGATASVTRNFKWASSADFPGSPYPSESYGDYVFVVFPREGLRFRSVERRSKFHRPDLGEPEEYITEDDIGYNDSLLIKDEHEWVLLKDRIGIDRKTALQILGRTEEEQRVWEDRVLAQISTIENIRERMQDARDRGKYNVGIVAMEMPLIDKDGKRLISVGGKGGGQGTYMADVPWAVAQKGIGSFVFKPLFSRDVIETYGDIEGFLKAYNGLHLMDIGVPVGSGVINLDIMYIEQEGVPVFLIYDPDNNFFKELYGDPDSIRGYIEAILLSLAPIIIAEKLDIQFEAYHFNDWQSALGPVFLKELYKGRKWLLGYPPAVLFTTHNLEYQGLFPGEIVIARDEPLIQYLLDRGILSVSADTVDLFRLTGLRRDLQYDVHNGLEFWSRFPGGEIPGRHNLMKGAFLFSDRILFVSEGHKREALTVKRGYGLDSVLRGIQHKLAAVYNGIRADRHRPQIEGDIVAFKERSKRVFQEKAGFDSTNPKNLVLSIISRIVKQKGLNVLFTPIYEGGPELIDALLSISDKDTGAKLQLFILGTAGDMRGEEIAKKLRAKAGDERYRDNFRFVDEFNPGLAKQAGLGSQLGLMPSIDEPGGLANQEMALLLTLLIVTERGGLNDFYKMNGTPVEPVPGFEIDNDPESVKERMMSAKAIYDAVKRLFDIYVNHPDQYRELLEKVSRFNPDWGGRIGQYDRVYLEAIRSVGPRDIKTRIIDAIQENGGRITYAEFMRYALHDPDFGYYGAGLVDFSRTHTAGKTFATDAMDPDFAIGLARQFYIMWEQMGKPGQFDIVEMGAGDGTLCLNILNKIRRSMPDFYRIVKYTIVELSPALAKRQKEKILAHQPAVTWKEDGFRDGEITGVVFSNELADEFNSHRVIYDEKGDKLQEIYVGYDPERGGFYEIVDDVSNERITEYMQVIYDQTGRRIGAGTEVAVSLEMVDWIRNVARALKRGVVLTFDYGHTDWHELLNAGRPSVYNFNLPIPKPLVLGSDLTYYVDFQSLEWYGRQAGLKKEWLGDANTYISRFSDMMRTSRSNVLVQSKGIKIQEAVRNILKKLKGIGLNKGAIPGIPSEGDIGVGEVLDELIQIAGKSESSSEEVLINLIVKGDGLEQYIDKTGMEGVIEKARLIKHTEEEALKKLEQVKGIGINIIDAHTLIGMREDEARLVLGKLKGEIAIVIFNRGDEGVLRVVDTSRVTIVRADEIGERLPEEVAIEKIRAGRSDIAIRDVSVLASLENVVKGRWRVALSNFHYVILNSRSLSVTAVLNMYHELPQDIKAYLNQTGLGVEVIKRSSLQEERFEPERYEKNAITEIGKAA